MCAIFLAVQRGAWIDRAHAYKAAGWKIDPHKPPKLKLKSEPAAPELDANDMPDMIPWMRQAVGGGTGGSSIQQF